MDRTSILRDAIDYMKELLDKINKLQELGSNPNLITNESMVRNSPKVKRNTGIYVLCYISFQYSYCLVSYKSIRITNKLLNIPPSYIETIFPSPKIYR